MIGGGGGRRADSTLLDFDRLPGHYISALVSHLSTCGSQTVDLSGYAAIDQICDYYQTLNERPVKSEVKPGYLLEQLPSESLVFLPMISSTIPALPDL